LAPGPHFQAWGQSVVVFQNPFNSAHHFKPNFTEDEINDHSSCAASPGNNLRRKKPTRKGQTLIPPEMGISWQYTSQNRISAPNATNPPKNVAGPPRTVTKLPTNVKNLTLNITRTNRSCRKPDFANASLQDEPIHVERHPARSVQIKASICLFLILRSYPTV